MGLELGQLGINSDVLNGIDPSTAQSAVIISGPEKQDQAPSKRPGYVGNVLG